MAPDPQVSSSCLFLKRHQMAFRDLEPSVLGKCWYIYNDGPLNCRHFTLAVKQQKWCEHNISVLK